MQWSYQTPLVSTQTAPVIRGGLSDSDKASKSEARVIPAPCLHSVPSIPLTVSVTLCPIPQTKNLCEPQDLLFFQEAFSVKLGNAG